MPRSTPWGASQNVIPLTRGFAWVSTASHGGIMVSEGQAKKHLSDAALKYGIPHNGYYCFEEDADASIVLFEAKAVRDELIRPFGKLCDMTPQELQEYLVKDLSSYHCEYLLEVGETPDPERYAIWQLRKASSLAYENRDPNLVTTLFSSSRVLLLDHLLAMTADGDEHIVTQESLDRAREADQNYNHFMSLDKLDVIDPTSIDCLTDRIATYAVQLSERYLKDIEANTEANQKEEAGNFYGPRSRFNGTLRSARDYYIRTIVEVNGVSREAADKTFMREIAHAAEQIHETFHQVDVLQEAMTAQAA